MLKLVEFIHSHDNWEELLSKDPYNIKISKDSLYGRDLMLFKYNQLNSDFNNDIVRECRGLILDEKTLEPVCVPFFKFGNYGESYCPNIDWMSAKITQKIDGCVSSDTLILTTDGMIKIEDICKNPKKYHLLTYNHDLEIIEEDEVINYSVQDSLDNWYELELEDGTILKVTGNHQIWCDNLKCYRRVDELLGNEDFLIYNY